ncbi:3-hydroxyisobutyrate dehydrogenase [Polynucleobacter sp. SHI8]|uniref:NAD(P)-dependent oxidoreductase n=1 Tax=unclassified Polynucleobacter TaxID=2640945 RepID=UPI002492B673|nr:MULTISPECIES: NAD(P)-dependent oxidoreductase [unclassified Polynucleobacter]BDW11730.1 3-hydroxyisobutyrate dehydrogenase [Polynucleobacter sp. SHI2]BDW14177.1 3-hydroxyisobutyrate dehydrogenase [Polynucleobacter sp. SHI8]
MSSLPNIVSIGFVGVGIMGQNMAGHLLAAGYQVNLYNRTKSKTDALVAKGAKWFDTPGEVAAHSNMIITMVGYPSDVEEVYFGEKGIIASANNAILVDMTTSSPSLARKIATEAAKKGLASLDAPVSGGDIGARDAKLTIMVGGDKAVFDHVLPILQKLGTSIILQGAAGMGQHTKMCNQIVIASTIMGVAEGLSYAKKVGLDPAVVLQSIGGGAASGFQLNVLGAKMIVGDYAPGFYVEHLIKDLKIALAEAEQMHLNLPGLALAKSLFEKMADRGLQRNGTQGIFQIYLD